MYAITELGFRVIASADDLAEGEIAVEEVPESLWGSIARQDAIRRRDDALRDTALALWPDSPLSEEKRVLILEYRRLLRELPDHPGFPECEFPESPIP